MAESVKCKTKVITDYSLLECVKQKQIRVFKHIFTKATTS